MPSREETLTAAQLATANLEIDASNVRLQELSSQLAELRQQLARQQLAGERTRGELEAAREEITSLARTTESQQQSIAELTREKSLLIEEVDQYNRQLLALKGEYETVKSKYEELIKPARSARGKYIAEVYYVKGESGNVIRYREPGDAGFSRLDLDEVESRLARLKREQGENLYVKIIIPEDSGLTYNEAWNFMRNLLVKYDYYYQD